MNKEEAIYFIDCLAKGVNPINGQIVESNSFINDVIFTRKMFELKDYIANNVDKKITKMPFTLLNKEGVVNGPACMSLFLGRINQLNSAENMKQLKRTPIVNWLIENKYLEKIDKKTVITDKGLDSGIYYEKRSRGGEEYVIITYPEDLLINILDLIESGKIA